MSKYVIGIDGGGTNARLCAVDQNGGIIYEGFGGGTNLGSSSEEQVRCVLKSLIGACIERLGNRPSAVCIGSAGIVNNASVELMKRILTEASGIHNVTVYNDAVIALKANLGNDAGISITAGTGTICLAQNENGRTLRVSGWGHICSDEGSAYYIVRKALEKICLSHDKRIGQTKLTEEFFNAVKADNFDDMIAVIYSEYRDKDRLASLARLVDTAVDNGDITAKEVLEDAAHQLFDICDFAAKTLFDKNKPFRVVKNGGVLKNCAIVRAGFEELMKNKYPLCKLEFGKRPAVLGAADYALHLFCNQL